MNVWTGIFLGAWCLVSLVFAGLLLLVLRRQNQLSARLNAQEKNSTQASVQAQSAGKVQFDVVSSQLSALHKEQMEQAASMDRVLDQMQAMNQVMTNTKLRGSWGEYQMENLIRVYAGENPAIYSAQYRLDNGRIADGAFHLPGSLQVLCIDSKFPMENFLLMQEHEEDRAFYQKELRRNVKKHIDDVATKYITSQTVNTALLFIPSEAIYQEICGPLCELLHYALKKHVMLVSPTTLSGVVYTLQASTRDFYRAQNLASIEKELSVLQQEFENLLQKVERADKALSASIGHVTGVHQALKKGIARLDQTLEGKQEIYGTAGSRFEHPEDQSQPTAGSQGIFGPAEF